jgi:hypothetical protein
MNKKDCEHIGFLLCSLLSREMSPERFAELLINHDKRIEYELQEFQETEEQEERILERFNDLMVERLGHDWCLMAEAEIIKKDLFEQATKEITENE